jgi:arylsulfatase A-like enzyme
MRTRTLHACFFAFAFGAILAGVESLVVLQTTGLASLFPFAEIWEVQWRYGIVSILFLPIAWGLAKLLRLRQESPFQTATWVFLGLSWLIGNWWVHSELLRNVSKWEPTSLAWWFGTTLTVLFGHRLLCRLEKHRPLFTLVAIGLFLPALGQVVYAPSAKETTAITASPTAPDVTIVVIDTLRADHLGCYGYQRADGEETSPFMDSLAQRGALFEDCWAQAPWTRPSMASLHSGLYGSAHQVNDTFSRLPQEAITMAELFQNQGYRTAAFSANENVSPVFGFDQGFDHFWNTGSRPLITFTTWGDWKHKLYNKILRRAMFDGGDWAALVNQQVFAWLTEESKKPTFTYVHYIDPHTPYDPPENGYAFAGDRPDLAPVLKKAKTFQHVRTYPFGARDTLSDDLLGRVIKLYDAEIRYVDGQLEQLVAQLKSSGNLEPHDWLFVMSDHGEEFQEHQQWGHGQSLFQEQLHVPLLVLGPQATPGHRIKNPVNLIDVHATLVGISGLKQTLANSPAIPLQPLLLKSPSALIRAQYAERLQEGRALHAVRKGMRKLIDMPDLEEEGNRFRMYFDLTQNPQEQLTVKAPNWREGEELDRQDSAFQAPLDLLQLLETTLKSAIRTALGEETAEADAETQRKLAELGYIGDDGKLQLGN